MTPVGLNYSGGASSEWMIHAILHGDLVRPEHIAVFCADTGDEHEWTYESMARVEKLCRAGGIPFFNVSTHRGETLSGAVMSATRGERTRLDNPPFWTENQGGGRGQLLQRCTQIWKTRPIRRAQSEWLASLGLPKKITTWIGFAVDEQHRAVKAVANNDVKWAQFDFPAIRLGKTRGAQRADIQRYTQKPPVRFSACIHCPYKDPARWRQTTESDLEKAIAMDEAIRHGLEHVAVDEPCYLTDRLIPIEQLIRRGDPQPALPGLESYCDGGECFL